MPTLIPINVYQKGSDNTVPIVRQSKFVAYLKALLTSVFNLQTVITNNYLAGATYSAWSNATTYNFGDRVTLDMLVGNASYEYINPTSSAGNYVTDTNYWYKITNDNIGLTERLNFNAQKMQLEYILNRRFSPLTITPPFGSAGVTIYITNNTSFAPILWTGNGNNSSKFTAPKSSSRFYYCPPKASVTTYLSAYNFTIYVPLALLTALRPTIADAKRMISKEVDKYNNAGMIYDIQHY